MPFCMHHFKTVCLYALSLKLTLASNPDTISYLLVRAALFGFMAWHLGFSVARLKKGYTTWLRFLSVHRIF